MSDTLSPSGGTTLSSVGTFTLTTALDGAGTYEVTLWGGEGGLDTGAGSVGGVGLGGEIGGSVSLSAGEELVVVVGSNGVSANNGGNGGNATIL